MTWAGLSVHATGAIAEGACISGRLEQIDIAIDQGGRPCSTGAQELTSDSLMTLGILHPRRTTVRLMDRRHVPDTPADRFLAFWQGLSGGPERLREAIGAFDIDG